MNPSGRVSAQNVIRSGAPNTRLPHSRAGVDNNTIMSKMIRDPNGESRERTDSPYLGNFGYLQESADVMATNIDDYKNHMAMLPEIELCIQVLLSLILTPKDIDKIELKHAVEPNILVAEMAQEMLEILKEAEQNYKIKSLLQEKLRKALVSEGADVSIVIPENSLDDLINGRGAHKITLESFREKGLYNDISKPRGFMANGPKTAPAAGVKMTLESMLDGLSRPPEVVDKLEPLKVAGTMMDGNKWDFSKLTGFVMPELFDNPQMMKLEDIVSSIKRTQTNMAIESFGGNSMFGNIEAMYHSPDHKPEDIVMMMRQEEASREAVGPPLWKGAPTESCMPVVRPGSPSKPVGYLFLLDEFGAFISRSARSDYMRNISAGVFNNRNAVSGMLNNMADQLNMEDGFSQQLMTMQAVQAFRELALRDIENRLLHGSVGNVTVSRVEMAYDLMFERALAGKQTRVVYVPADMVIYWTYDYNDNGTGRSLMEDNKILSSIRALTMFMNIETHIRNSIDHRTLNITVDEDDPNKSRTKEMILHEYARNRGNSIPWASSNPRRMVEVAQNSGLAVSVKGGDNYPGTEVSIDSRPVEYKEVNLDLDEDLRKRQTMGFGLAPEIVDLSTQIEFSSKMATSNELSLKRALALQDRTNLFIRETLIKLVLNHKGYMDKMRKAVGNHIDKMDKKIVAKLGEDYFITAFFSIYTCTLPRPDTGLANRMTDLDDYVSAIEKVLDNIVPDDLMQSNVTGESANEWVAVLKASVKSTLVLDYCRSNSILPEVTNLFKNDTAEDPGSMLVMDGVVNAGRLTKIIQGMGLQLYSAALISENQMATLKERLDANRVEGTEAGEGSETTGGGSGGDDFDSDFGGDDDFGDFDMGDEDGDGDGGEFDFGDDSGDDSSSEDSSSTSDDSSNDDSTV